MSEICWQGAIVSIYLTDNPAGLIEYKIVLDVYKNHSYNCMVS